MFAIYKRELKSYFNSFIGFLFIGAVLFILGLYFTVYNLVYGYPYISYAVSSAVFLLFIGVPVLTMRILSEERKQKTDQLILTAPVSVGSIVIGKFLALITIFAIPIVIIGIYPIVLSAFGSVPMAESYLSILGFFLYGMTCIAIGVLISSLTESQVIAAVISFGCLFLGYVMEGICSLISDTGNWITELLSCLDMYKRFNTFLTGTLDVSAVVYFISVTALVLFLTTQSIQKRRYSISVKSFSFGAYNTGMIGIFVVLTVVLNLLASELPSSVKTIDVTTQKIYSITDITKNFLKELEEEVTVYVLSGEQTQDSTLGTTLERIADESDYITVEYVDPAVNPRFYTNYSDSMVYTNSLIVESAKRFKVVNYEDIYEREYDYTYGTATTTGYDGEGQVMSAIAYVVSDDMPKIYMLEGHGEASLSATFKDSISKENVDYETINLMNYDEVPEDAQCIIINAPISDLSKDDYEKIKNYVNSGGNLFVISTYATGEMTNFNALLAEFELSITDGIVIEQDQNRYYQNQAFMLPEIRYDEITASVYTDYYVFVPYAQGIRVPEEDIENMSYTTLLATSDSAFSRSNLESVDSYKMEEGDEAGGFALGVRAEKNLSDETSATMVLYGSSYMFEDSASEIVSGANLMLFSGTIANLTDSEISVSVPVKSYEVSNLILNQSDIIIVAMITTVIIPLSMLIIGFAIWFGRRKK